MKIGVIAQRLGLPLFEALESAARIGFDGVQIYSVSYTERALDYTSSERRDLKKRLVELRLDLSAVCGELGGFGLRRSEDNSRTLELSKRNIDLACELGCRIVTSHIGVVRADRHDPLRLNQRDMLCAIGDYAASCGAVFAVETGPEKAETLKSLLDEVASPGVGVNFDPANLRMVLNRDPVAELRILAPYVVHTHIKDGVHFRVCDPEKVYAAFAAGGFARLEAETGKLFSETPIGQGSVPWESYLSELNALNPSLYLVIEREKTASTTEEMHAAIALINQFIPHL